MKTVIYHSADFDGIFCREIARKFLPDATLIGWNHGNAKIPMPKEGTVYILDLSPECLEITFGGETVPYYDRMVWIDHHQSSIATWPSSIPGYRIDGVAACRLAWQWFLHWVPDMNGGRGGINPEWIKPDKRLFVDRYVKEPLAVNLAGEYDIWDKRNPSAELFQHGLKSMDILVSTWDNLLSYEGESVVSVLLENGTCLQYAKTKENASIIADIGFTFQWEGLTWLACNHARYNSFLFTAGLKPEHDACFGFKFAGHCAGGKPCEEWAISLYHAPGKEHHDLSKIAMKYGGGGHKGACGFQISKLPFLT